MKPIRVLSCAVQEVLPILDQVYVSPDYVYTAEVTLIGALKRLEEPLDLIAISVHFNNGQFYDFLRLAKAHPKAKTVPIIVVHAGNEGNYEYIAQSVEIASKALGAAAVVPMTQWRQSMGDEAAFRKYREVIESVLAR